MGGRSAASAAWLLLLSLYLFPGGPIRFATCYYHTPCYDNVNRDPYGTHCSGVGDQCCDGLFNPTHTTALPNLQQFCDELFRTDDLAWTRPFQGFYPSGGSMPRRDWPKICNAGIGLQGNEKPQAYQMAPIKYKFMPRGISGDPNFSFKEYTNRLRFTDAVVAQEGFSFCIIGTHFRKSTFSLWEPLKGFLPLAEKSFDIGNHIDPFDSKKMNTFKRPNPDDLRIVPAGGTTPLKIQWPWDEASVPTHRFEYVWLGTQITREESSWKYSRRVPLRRGYEKRPAHPEWQPDEDCENPYVLEATMIEADGIPLHNYLHIKVYARPVNQPAGRNCPTGKIKLLMLEVRDQDGLPVGQFTDDVTCDQDEETTKSTLSCPTGAECRAHYGTKMNHVPCMFSHPKSVVHPSIFMFAADKFTSGGGGAGAASPGSSPTAPSPGGSSSATHDFCRNSQKPQNQRKPPKVQYKENPDQYVTEVHTTWRYAQMDEGWASELHFATMIVEDETPIQYYTSRLTMWSGVWTSTPCYRDQFSQTYPCPPSGYCTSCTWHFCCNTYQLTFPEYRPGGIQLGLLNSCVNESYNTNRPYGYSASYQVLKPTFHTRGGWDYFRKEYISPKFVNCHVPITSDPHSYYQKDSGNGILPLRKTLKNFLVDKYTLLGNSKYAPPQGEDHRWPGWGAGYSTTFELPDWHNLGMSKSTDGKVRYTAFLGKKQEHAILKLFDSAHQDPAVLKTEFDDQPFREYFGSRLIGSPSGIHAGVTELQKKQDSGDHEVTVEEMDTKSRCPCPFFPTTPPPELATKPAVEIEGRRTHVVNMLLAWVILVPFSFFVARFFKETYSRVFFLQEFWWYTMHVLSLLTALLFTFGGIYALKIKRTLGEPYEIVWTDATSAHIYMGYTVVGLFIVHLIFGAFRFIDNDLRVIQIGLHWLFGWLEYCCAVGCILSAAAIPSGILNCVTFGIYCVFIVYQVAFTLGMEYHLHQVDNELELNPPRAYMPPPMMRLFHRDAPHAKFRVIMLILYATGCFLFYLAMHVSMKWEGAEFSCFQPTAEEAPVEIT